MSSVIRPFFFNLQNTATTPVNTIRTTYNALKSNPELGKLLTKEVAIKTIGACAAVLAAYCSYQTMSAWNVSPLDPNLAFKPAVKSKDDLTSSALNLGVRQTQLFADASTDYCNASYVSPNFVDSIQASLKTDFSQAKPKTKYLEEVSDGQDDEISFNESARVCAAAAPATPKVYVPVTVGQHIQRMRQIESFTQASQGFCNASATNFRFPQNNQPKLKTDFSEHKSKAESGKKETYKNESFMPFCEEKSSFSESNPEINKSDDFEKSSEKSFQYEFPFQNEQVNHEPVNHNLDETSFSSQESKSVTPNFTSTVFKACITATILLGTLAKYQLNKWSKRQADDALVNAKSSPLPRALGSEVSEQQDLQVSKIDKDESENTNKNEKDAVVNETQASTKDNVSQTSTVVPSFKEGASLDKSKDSSDELETSEDSSSAVDHLLDSSEKEISSEEYKVEKKNRLDKNKFKDATKKPGSKNANGQTIVNKNITANRFLNKVCDTPPRTTLPHPPSSLTLSGLSISFPKSLKSNNTKDLFDSNYVKEASSTAIVMSNNNNSYHEYNEYSSSADDHLSDSSGQQTFAEDDEVENAKLHRQSMNKVIAQLPENADVDYTESDIYTNEELEAYANGASDSEDEGQPDLIGTEKTHEQESGINTSSSKQKDENKKLDKKKFTDRSTKPADKKANRKPIVNKNIEAKRFINNGYHSPTRPLAPYQPSSRTLSGATTSYPDSSKRNTKITFNRNDVKEAASAEESRNKDFSQQLNQEFTNNEASQGIALSDISNLVQPNPIPKAQPSLSPFSQGSRPKSNDQVQEQQPPLSPLSHSLQSNSKAKELLQSEETSDENAGWIENKGRGSFSPKRNLVEKKSPVKNSGEPSQSATNSPPLSPVSSMLKMGKFSLRIDSLKPKINYEASVFEDVDETHTFSLDDVNKS